MTKTTKPLSIAAAVLAACFCVSASSLAVASDPATASAVMMDGNGDEIGFANIVQGPHGILIHIRVSDLTPGKHGLISTAPGSAIPRTASNRPWVMSVRRQGRMA